MKMGAFTGIVMLALGTTAAAEPERAATVSLGVGVAGYDPIAEGFGGDPVGGAFVAGTLAWDRGLPVTDGVVWQGDVVPELTLARLADRNLGLIGARFELEVRQPRAAVRHHNWIAPRFGLISGGRSLVAGVDVGSGAVRSGWCLSWSIGALTWQDRSETAAPQMTIEARTAPGPVERMFALTFGVSIGSGY